MALPVVISTPIHLYRGDSRTLHFNFFADANNTVPIDLTAYGNVYKGTIRTKPDAVELEDMSIDDTDAATGKLVVTIAPSSWTALAGVKSVGWDIEVTDNTRSKVTTLVTGRFAVTLDYT